MAMRFLERELRAALSAIGRADLIERAVGSIELTDDGETVYVHLLPKQGWPGRAQGRAYVLAWEDYAPEGSDRMYCYRWLVGEAKRSIGENGEKIARWLEGK
ncbi:MAG TPA: hypothetical protein VFP63_07465 [Dehalococcoidia bacterium]|nr:hypothetical protein [Dehalococcoidia bacterium]